MLTNGTAAYHPDVYRSSDHDPGVLGLNLTPMPEKGLQGLQELTQVIADEANLRRGQEYQLLGLLRISGEALEALTRFENERPFRALAARTVAQTTLELLLRRVETFAKRGLVSEAQANQLQDRAQAFRALL